MTDRELKKYAKENKLDSVSVLAGYNLARDEVKQILIAGENTETGELLRMVGLDILPVELAKENEALRDKIEKILNDLPVWQREKYKDEV